MLKFPRTSLTFFFILFVLTKASSAGDTEWLHDFNIALQKSINLKKNILMVFSGSDWCRPCMKLTREVFEKDDFINFARANFVLLQLDFPRKSSNQLSDAQLAQNEKLADIYNAKGLFPLVILLDSNKKIIARTGYRPGGAEKYIQHLRMLIQNQKVKDKRLKKKESK